MAQSRQLAAIMFTDIVGYTALMGANERKAFELLRENREIQKPIIAEFNGRFIKEIGDGILASFQTVSDSVAAAVKIQERCKKEKALRLRIGIHLGEVVFEDNDVFGDGVNIASRLQAIAEPGGIYISESVHDNISNKDAIVSQFVKQQMLKNVKDPIKIYEVMTGMSSPAQPAGLRERATKFAAKSIAVLPFVNMSNDPDQEYFSDGMAEEILNSLAHLKDLKVAGRTSCFQFKGKNMDLREVGQKLNVNTVLEGSIRKQGNRLRITAQLIDIRDGFHLWSEKYDRDIEDIFAIQDEIALAITEKLKVTFFGNDRELITKNHTDNTEAYQFYLQGRYFWNRRNEDELKISVRYYQKAIEKDPDYALAWAGLADSYNLLGEYGNFTRAEIYPKAKAAATRALSIDDELAEAHISLASLLMLDDWDWENSGREFRLGVESNPNYVTGHHWYSEWLMYTGHFEESLNEISRAAELDPVSVGIIKDKGLILYYCRKYTEAIQLATSALELYPEFAPVHRLLSLSYQGMKMYDSALAENEKWGKLTGNTFKKTVADAFLYALSDRKEEAKKIVDNLKEEEMIEGKDFRSVALVYGALGENDRAFEFLERSYQSHETSLCSFNIDPKLDMLRDDPRFTTLLRKIGLA